MKIQKLLKIAFLAETSIMAGIILGYLTFPTQAVSLEIYEVLAAIVAAQITTSGIYGMKQLT